MEIYRMYNVYEDNMNPTNPPLNIPYSVARSTGRPFSVGYFVVYIG